MNTCIKCGCQDAYPSLPPCPVPAVCPNPQPCSEVFDAQCIVFTLPDIECGTDVVVAQDDTVAEALAGIVSYFCTEISGFVQSVTGLNTDNTDPQNPIVRISVDGTTITGLGTPASPLVAIGGGGGIGGSGIQNYVARWTPDGSTLGTGTIRDSGTTIGIGTAPQVGQLVKALTTTQGVAYSITQAFSGSSKGIELVVSNGSGLCIGAQFAVRTNSSINVASLNEAGNNIYNFTSYIPANSNIGSIVMAQDANADNNYGLVSIVSLPSLTTNNHIGARFIVDNGVTNYGLQIEDGTEGVGKVLTCMTSDGKANWAEIPKPGYLTVTHDNTSLNVALTNIVGPVTYEWSFADTNPGLLFTSATNIATVTFSRNENTAQYQPFVMDITDTIATYIHRYNALVKIRVVDSNGFIYTEYYNHSIEKSQFD